MSEWYKAKWNDIELDSGEIEIYVTNNENGNIYVTVKVEDIKRLLDLV